jgi:hypothetical protein
MTFDGEVERIWKVAVVAKQRYSPGIYLEGLRKIIDNLKYDSQCPGRGSNGAPLDKKVILFTIDVERTGSLQTMTYLFYNVIALFRR